ncbi:S24 family peptidase [Yersinia rochesterensis]|uniref:LexA family protein n=1 Tax=Yersinia rochesterensis TaxID=1604335 RepID=UPI00285302D4|nr:S24 family peptidase [Yersinia rochesterensis]MDR5020526.1 S24 family peptidase [Yersinia rochesterensis]
MDIKDIRRLRLKEWFADKPLPEKEKSYLSQLITGKSTSFGEKAARRLESTYGMPSGHLDLAVAQEKSNVTFVAPYVKGNKYPLISWVSAGAWCEAIEPYTLKDIDEWFESDARIEGNGFWLRVEGDSMTAPTGISIPEDTLVLFDTGREARNGSLVIAKLESANEATFKKLIIDGGDKYLRGLNPAWPLVPINGNCKIIGVAVETKLRLV